MDQATLQRLVGDGRYTIDRLLGRGGMSTVWLAHDRLRGEYVAIKLLHQELSDDAEFRLRFANEAKAARSVHSPNVVRIDGFEETISGGAGACYIVMEYIRGESLASFLRRERHLKADLALDVIEQTAHGLSAIHAANLIHRDIKPGNLLVTPRGTVKITDFGIAKAAEAVPLTRTGMVVGTAQYVSPEQAQGRPVSPATDIYSLGCVAYEMLTGTRPFTGDTSVAVAMAHINNAPPPMPRSIHPHIRELVGIMLRKDPRRRYADGRELASAVRVVRSGNRPPQPVGVQPAVHRQSNAANPATHELGAMTRPRNPGAAPTGATGAMAPGSAAMPQMPPMPQVPQRAQRRPVPAPPLPPPRRPKKKKAKSPGCLAFLLMLLLFLGAVALVATELERRGLVTVDLPGITSIAYSSSTSAIASILTAISNYGGTV